MLWRKNSRLKIWVFSLVGTNRLDSNSVLRIVSLSNGDLLAWFSISGKTYRVLATAILRTNSLPISGIVTASSSTASYLDLSATKVQKFHRVNVVP